MNELQQRIITAVLGSIIIIGGTLLHKFTFGFVFLVISIISSIEYIKITRLGLISDTKQWSLILVNAFVFLLGFLIAIKVLPNQYRILGLLPIFLLYSAGILGRSAPDFRLSSLLISGHVYIGLPLMLLNYIYLNNNDYWPSYVIAILFFVWANDVGAYFAGKSFGKHKMSPRVSPKKTWEGFVGGLLTAMFVGFVYSKFSQNLQVHEWVTFALFAGIGSSFGDLVSSSLKRTFGVKDSGTLLPGHGGFIDRFDGFYIAIIFSFAYLSLLGITN